MIFDCRSHPCGSWRFSLTEETAQCTTRCLDGLAEHRKNRVFEYLQNGNADIATTCHWWASCWASGIFTFNVKTPIIFFSMFTGHMGTPTCTICLCVGVWNSQGFDLPEVLKHCIFIWFEWNYFAETPRANLNQELFWDTYLYNLSASFDLKSWRSRLQKVSNRELKTWESTVVITQCYSKFQQLIMNN